MKLPKKPVAYFCAEYATEDGLPTYAGGLGILAGDTVMAASDRDYPFIGFGLLYKGKASRQNMDNQGMTYETEKTYDIEALGYQKLKLEGKDVRLVANFENTDIYIESYFKKYSKNTILFLLTTDVENNPSSWREIMDEVYCCDDAMQLKQMLILGVGGVKLLRELSIEPKLYHFNEGRPIFAFWELTHHIMCENAIDYNLAQEIARGKIIYTNHTLLKAGNLTFPIGQVQKYASAYVSETDVPSYELIKKGISEKGKFSITNFALNISSQTSAVSKPHAKLSQKQWPHYNWKAITNGIHLPTWQDERFREKNLTDKAVWQIHREKKLQTMEKVRERTGFSYNINRLVVGWARRVTGYKNMSALFADTQRLAKIIKNDDRPVQLLIAGKAHPGDKWAKGEIQKVVGYMQGVLSGHALFVTDYDKELAKHLVSGSDVWLNTPDFGMEACGTSGMKAAANGVLNITVADGWAKEISWKNMGWILDHDRMADSIYETLQKKVIPLYFKKDEGEMPHDWIQMMKKSIDVVSKNYSARAMFDNYVEKLYG